MALDLSQALTQSLPAVTAVEDHLEHALLNILMNAIESCVEREDGRIVVTAKVIDRSVVLGFADNGAACRGSARAPVRRFATTKDRRSPGWGWPLRATC